jgi:hypothetical protein
MISWSDFPRTDSASLRAFTKYVSAYKRPSHVESSPSLWGSRIQPHDIRQGSLGDCYMVAVASALAEYPNRVKKLFVQNAYNKEGIFALNLYIKGRPEVITIDDQLPFTST